MTSVFNRLSDPSTACLMVSGRLSCPSCFPSAANRKPNFVAITTCLRNGATTSPDVHTTKYRLWGGPDSMRFPALCLALLATGFINAPTPAPVAPELLAGLRWRNLGPFRGGRISAVSGAIGQPGVFYVGLPMGGVWKTTSAGETWIPIFDAVTDASSVGALEVAPSDANVIYVGMGDLIAGGGI